MIFVKVIPDRFSKDGINARTATDPIGVGKADQPFIRRPTRGIQLKEDTFATLRLVADGTGGNQPLVDGGSRRMNKSSEPIRIGNMRATDVYSNFLLQQVSEDRSEKSQILETFGEAYIFLFGERPRVVNFQGILINTQDFNWEAEWWHNYENYLRGTRCVENNCRVYLSYDNTIVGGYIISTAASKNAQERNYVNFQFQLFVTYYDNFSQIGSDNAYPGLSRPSADMPLIERPETRTLFQGLEDVVARASDAWKNIQGSVDSVLGTVGGLMNADLGARIPLGFSGVTADDNVQIGDIEYGGAVSYTFSENSDEYVGVGDHYGSATAFLSADGSVGGELEYGQGLVDKVRAGWEKAGFGPPPNALGPVSSFLVSKGMGLAAAGATTAWQKVSQALTPGSADDPYDPSERGNADNSLSQSLIESELG